MKEILIGLFNFFGLALWVEIITDLPQCIYYFGPFLVKKDAEAAIEGYVEDLKNEGAQGFDINLKRCKPNNLTIFDELSEMGKPGTIPSFSGQTF